MNQVKIYTVLSDQLSPPVIGEGFCVDMVRHSDYAALEAKCAALAAMQQQVIRKALDECSEYLDRDCIMETNGISYEDAAQREVGAMALHDALLRRGAE